jgi:cytochrome c-type biogenesis protein CcsB
MELTQTLDRPWTRQRSWFDWVYAVMLVAGAIYALRRFAPFMDGYEQVILFAAAIVFTVLGWQWRPIRNLVVAAAFLAFAGLSSYAGELARADKAFLLKYFLSSQTAILWMCTLFFAATLCYWWSLLRAREGSTHFAGQVATGLSWAAVVMGTTGMLVRWYESYLVGIDVGHIPISNLYEVFVLFCLITTLFHLYYEERHNTKTAGAFVLLVVSAAVCFLLWYTFDRGAHEIQPLVPALQSWWMKIHVPANFVGYGCFALAAMLAFAYIVKGDHRPAWTLAGLGVIAILFFVLPYLLGKGAPSRFWLVFFVVLVVIVGAISAVRPFVAARLPAVEVLDEIMYKSIAVGFGFFTVATILGALWAAEAWGTYWQWDPKETWALIVWLNYAAWLHMRLVAGLRGPVLAWWAFIGLIVTTFAFLGVNIFLSGLHSYGQL